MPTFRLNFLSVQILRRRPKKTIHQCTPKSLALHLFTTDDADLPPVAFAEEFKKLTGIFLDRTAQLFQFEVFSAIVDTDICRTFRIRNPLIGNNDLYICERFVMLVTQSRAARGLAAFIAHNKR